MAPKFVRMGSQPADKVIFYTDLRKMSTLWFLLTHEVELGTLDRFVDMTMVGGRKVYENDRPPRRLRPNSVKGRLPEQARDKAAVSPAADCGIHKRMNKFTHRTRRKVDVK